MYKLTKGKYIMQFTTNGLTGKKIFTQVEFVSFTKLLLTAPIFTVKNSTIKVINEKTTYNGFDVSFYSMPLNLGLDFDTVLFLVKKRFEENSYLIKCSLTEFYNFVDPERKDMNNRNNAYKLRIEESLKRVKSINITLKNATKTIICSMINNAYIDYENNELVIEFNKFFDNFFSVDSNAIYNVNRQTLRSINSEYGKALYLFYICNNANKEENTISLNSLKERFLFSGKEDKKFVKKMRDANKELQDMELLTVNKEIKDGRSRTVGFKVLVNLKAKPQTMKLWKDQPDIKKADEKEEEKPIVVKDAFIEKFNDFMKKTGRV